MIWLHFFPLRHLEHVLTKCTLFYHRTIKHLHISFNLVCYSVQESYSRLLLAVYHLILIPKHIFNVLNGSLFHVSVSSWQLVVACILLTQHLVLWFTSYLAMFFPNSLPFITDAKQSGKVLTFYMVSILKSLYMSSQVTWQGVKNSMNNEFLFIIG